MRVILAVLVLPAIALSAVAGELVTRYDLATEIGETRLDNGLTVLTLERHDAPVVCCQIWYRVGSADELRGETGLTHFLEHLMFKGTDRYGRGEIDRITLELGGSNNAGTYKDWTYYYFNFASDRWEAALTVEANRMRNLAFDPVEFESERKVVLEELDMGRDGPWGELDETIEAVAFLAHPYRHPVIGWQEDLIRIPRERVRDFYDRHYHPRNAALVLVGDFETRAALAKVAGLFGPIPAGPDLPRERTPEPPQNGERRLVVERPAKLARVEILHHTVPASHPEDVVLDVVARLLAGSRASRLHRRLVEEEQISTFVAATNDSRLDPGLFWVWSEAREGVAADHVETALVEELDRLAREGPEEAELARVKVAMITELVFRRATAEGMADEIGHLASVSDWRRSGDIVERIGAVSAEDVRSVAARTFRARNRTVGVAVPAAEGGGAGGGERAPERRRRAPAHRNPGAAGATRVQISPTVATLPGGATLLIARHAAIPGFALNVHVRGSRLYESRPGLAELTGRALLEGAGGLGAAELAAELEGFGVTVDSGAGGLTARCLSEFAPEAVRLIAAILLHPELADEAVAKVRDRMLAELAAEADDPQTVAERAFAAAVYDRHPWGRPSLGTPESVRELTAEHARAHHREFYDQANLVISAVSDREPEEMEEIFRDCLGTGGEEVGPGNPEARPAPARPGGFPMIPEPAAREIRLAADTDQANVFLGHVGIRRDDPDYFPLLVMDYVLGRGPGFTDRLSRTVRDRDGLAYDVWAGISGSAGEEPGVFVAYVGTAAPQADRASQAILAEVRRIREEPVTERELAGAKAYLTGSFVFQYETPVQIAARLIELYRHRLGFDYPEKFAKAVNAVTAEDVLRVARKHLHPDRMIRVVVGPGK